jgi:putative membrane protein
MDSGLIAEPVIGPRFARTRWRCPGMASEEVSPYAIVRSEACFQFSVVYISRAKGARGMTTLFAFLHHLSAFTLVSAVAIEFTLIRQELTLSSARRLQVTDTVLGIAAGALFIVGLLRVFYFEKGADYYFHSHAFTAKFSIFIALGLLSIIPTVEFLSWRSALGARQVPAVSAKKLRLITAVIHGELLSIVIILLCAAIMARGGWV